MQLNAPAKAVGYLFIPGYNLYWIFRVFPGLSTAISNWLKAIDEEPGQTRQLAFYICISWLTIIAAPIATTIFLPLWIYRVEKSINKASEKGKDKELPPLDSEQIKEFNYFSHSKFSLILKITIPIVSLISTACLAGTLYGYRRYNTDGILFSASCAIVFTLCYSICFAMWQKRTWNIVPKEYRNGIKPERVGLFLFIPLFNLYWIFRIIPGLSQAISNWQNDGKLYGKKIGMVFCICMAVLFPLNFLNFILLPAWHEIAYQIGRNICAVIIVVSSIPQTMLLPMWLHQIKISEAK